MTKESSAIHLNLKEARRLALRCQLLEGSTKLPSGKEGAARVIEHLGYVQIDTISVIERAHHHVLWTRVRDYQPAMLDELLAKDRRVFEFWAHAVSYVPMSDYRYYRTRMKVFLDGNPRNEKWDPYSRELKWIKENRKLMNDVLGRIRQEGPLGTADFEHPKDAGRRSPWGRKPAKIALEMLFYTGELMVTERRSFQRIFDLTERVLPPTVDTTEPDEREVARFAILRALNAMGFATPREIREYITMAGQPAIEQTLTDMIESGEVACFTIDALPDRTAPFLPRPACGERAGVRGRTYFTLSRLLDQPPKWLGSRPQVHVLSPFDNLIAARERTNRLFGFDYQLECYKVPAQRKYGYFVLPVLYGDQFMARLDAKVERKSNCLQVISLIFEPDFRDYDAALEPLARKLMTFAGFNRAACTVLKEVKPVKLKRPLERLLKSI